MVRLADLVLDRTLQCRVEVVEETVADYAEALAEGAELPPIKVVRVVDDGRQCVTDGWHRYLAHKRAGREQIAAVIRDGSRRDALLEAVAANATHGLSRTRDDKRRAVAVLLQDEEWCALSSRELGRLAGVSHAFVSGVRKGYGIRKGEVLTAERVAEVDGELPPRWAALVEATSGWHHEDLVAMRRARSLDEVTKAANRLQHCSQLGPSIELRLEELADRDWPWEDDDNATRRAARARGLDTAEEIGAALLARVCPDRFELWKAYRAVRELNRMSRWEIEEICGWTHRPAIAQAARTRRGRLAAEERERRAADPWTAAQDLACVKDPEAFAAGVAAAPKAVIVSLLSHADRLPREEVDGAIRARAVELECEVLACPDPRCGGWALAERAWCWKCRNDVGARERQLEHTMRAAGELLEHPGRQLEAGGVVVDGDALAVLRELLRASEQDDHAFAKWMAAAPSEDLRAALQWHVSRDQGPPETFTSGNEPAEASL